MDDGELIRRIRQGETQYLNLLIERHYEHICNYSYWKTRDIEAAQDITQETFYRFFRNFETYTHQGKCRAYLYTIARRLCSDYYQNQSQCQQQLLPFDEIKAAHQGKAPSVEEMMENRQSTAAVHELVRDLPPEQQEALILRFCYDLKFREIADITGVPLCKVQYRVRYGLKALKKKLERERCHEEEACISNSKTATAAPYASS